MKRLAVRQAIVLALIAAALGLISYTVFLLRAEPGAAILFAVLLVILTATAAVSGAIVTPESTQPMPRRLLFGYATWVSYRSGRFYSNALWLCLMIGLLWILGPDAVYRIQVACGDSSSVTASSFLGREIRSACEAHRANIRLYMPLRSMTAAKDRISCLDNSGAAYAAVALTGPFVRCSAPAPRPKLRIDRMEPPVVEAHHVRLYRLYGRGFSANTTVNVDSAAFVGSSLTRESDRHPAAVDPAGDWMDVFISIMAVSGRDQVRITVSDAEQRQQVSLNVPVQARTGR